jgi:hypothetical protein
VAVWNFEESAWETMVTVTVFPDMGMLVGAV